MEEYRRWEGNIKMDLKEIGVDVMSWLIFAFGHHVMISWPLSAVITLPRTDFRSN